MTLADKVDLYVEQVKLLTEDIALSSSTLKRLLEQSANDPDGSKVQVQFFVLVYFFPIGTPRFSLNIGSELVRYYVLAV